jgi:lysozyme
MRAINEKGLAIIKSSEGCKLDRYRCSAGKWTIGWGHKITFGEPFDTNTITQEQADWLLEKDLEEKEIEVSNVNVPLTDNEFSALVSFVYNIGWAKFATSTLLNKLNEGDYQGAANEFGKWIYAKGIPMNGLKIRRAKERSLFLER